MSSKNWLIALMGPVAFGCGSSAEGAPCPFSCPATYSGVTLVVNAAADGGVVSGVEATLSGPTTETMSCEPNGTATLCTWSSGPVTAGTYSLLVTAPGFQSASLSATVTVAADPHCGCVGATLQPSMVTLDPS